MVWSRNPGILVAAIALGLAYLAGLAVVSAAGEEESETSRVPLPEIPKGQGENCVEDTDFMRRNHMTLLMHQRDDTVLEGIREKKHSLKECVSCHVVTGPDAMAVTAASPKHFCRSCHDYAAVKIDCFQCHASRPDAAPATGDHSSAVAGVE
jgi:predicted CXXCH cytochrome family protein